MDSFAVLAQALSKPIQLSVSMEDSQHVKDLEARCASLQSERDQLFHRWECCSSVLSQIREFCGSHDVILPPALSFVTPWE